ncbi:MAG: OmpA/MotB domain protein [Oscillospiraceae bacterium]|nr:OmpA/MotB domain protein [Oscillospiraceae bacterium]
MAKKPKVEKDTSERWLLTYSDLMNLLLILFIILYASSKADVTQFQQVAESLRIGFSSISTSQAAIESSSSGGGSSSSEDGSLDSSDSVLDSGMIGVIDNAISSTDTGESDSEGSGTQDVQYQNFYDALMTLLEENQLTQSVTVSLEEKGIAISFADNVLFAKSSAVLNGDANTIIDKIGYLLTQLPYSYILVEGHTDSDKIHTQYYEDNMDLSTKRAANVWRRLVACGLSPEKMASVGYGEYRPVAPNDTVENKAKNRRVVITILKKELSTNDNATIDDSGADTPAAEIAAGANGTAAEETG